MPLSVLSGNWWQQVQIIASRSVTSPLSKLKGSESTMAHILKRVSNKVLSLTRRYETIGVDSCNINYQTRMTLAATAQYARLRMTVGGFLFQSLFVQMV